jgi:hypothetical protein
MDDDRDGFVADLKKQRIWKLVRLSRTVVFAWLGLWCLSQVAAARLPAGPAKDTAIAASKALSAGVSGYLAFLVVVPLLLLVSFLIIRLTAR